MNSPGTTVPAPTGVALSSRNATLTIVSDGRSTDISAKPLSLVAGLASERAFRTSVSTVPAATLPIEYTTAMLCDAPDARARIGAPSPAVPFTDTILSVVPGEVGRAATQ